MTKYTKFINKKSTLKLIGNESYNERFATFLKYTNQKHTTSAIIKCFVQTLSNNTSLLNKDQLSILDIGCGEGTFATQLLNAIQPVYKNKITYTGIDNNPEFVEKCSIISSPNTTINILEQDAFAEKPNFPPSDVVTSSHTIYYCYNPSDPELSHTKATRFINNAVGTLGKDRIAIMMHEGPGSHYLIGKDFGTSFMPDSTLTIAQICKENNLSVFSIPFTTQLRFPLLSDTSWNSLRNISTATMVAHIPEMQDSVLLMGFLLQQDLRVLEEKGTLSPFIDTIRNTLEQNNGCLVGRSEIQTILSVERTRDFEKTIERCCETVKHQLPMVLASMTPVKER